MYRVWQRAIGFTTSVQHGRLNNTLNNKQGRLARDHSRFTASNPRNLLGLGALCLLAMKKVDSSSLLSGFTKSPANVGLRPFHTSLQLCQSWLAGSKI
jgi:hypothetical protein